MCNACNVLNINGVNCHETGCPEAWRDYSRECNECGCDFQPESRYQSICDDCANPQDEPESFEDYFRDVEMGGGEDESFDFGNDGDVDYYAAMIINKADRERFPDDIGTLDTHVVIHHDNQGFVTVSAVPHSDMVSIRGEYEAFCEEMADAD